MTQQHIATLAYGSRKRHGAPYWVTLAAGFIAAAVELLCDALIQVELGDFNFAALWWRDYLGFVDALDECLGERDGCLYRCGEQLELTRRESA